MEPKCLPSSGSELLKVDYVNSQMASSDQLNENVIYSRIGSEIGSDVVISKNIAQFKVDDSDGGSSEDITSDGHQSNEMNVINIMRDHQYESAGIYLETPVIDENNICLTSHDYEQAKPKRLSDEFLLSDDNDDERNNADEVENLSLETPSNDNQSSNLGLNSDDNDSSENSPSSESIKYVEEDDTSSLCSNLVNELNDESQLLEKPSSSSSTSGVDGDVVDGCSMSSAGTSNEKSQSPGTSSESTVSYYDNDVQSMDAIERRDFEHEQRLTGGIILKTSSLAKSENILKINLVRTSGSTSKSETASSAGVVGERAVSSDSKCTYKSVEHSTTPTSSRNCKSRVTKSTAKLNLSSTLDHIDFHSDGNSVTRATTATLRHDQNVKPCSVVLEPCSSRSFLGESSKMSQSSSSSSSAEVDAFSTNSSSNDSEACEHSGTSSNHSSINSCTSKPGCSGVDNTARSILKKQSVYYNPVVPRLKKLVTFEEKVNEIPGIQYPGEVEESDSQDDDEAQEESRLVNNVLAAKLKQIVQRTAPAEVRQEIMKQICENFNLERGDVEGDVEAVKGADVPIEEVDDNREYLDPIMDPVGEIGMGNEQNDNDYDDETWQDCETGSDEEICTCHDNDNDSSTNVAVDDRILRQDSVDDLPSKDVDLSSYIQIASMSDEIFLPDNNLSSPEYSTLQRKRKLNESSSSGRMYDSDSSYGGESSSGRKRMAFDGSLTPRSSQTALISSPSTPFGRRTPRSIIPTRDNPPPELQDWLVQFQRWSHAERLLAVDRLIEHCEPTQVRHMMKVIEPQFQRDFISLLPRELALQVLSYLDPSDLLRAAQTCRSWRFLCDDNLLWKEKCRKAQILTEPKTDKPKRGRAGNMPPISSAWKAAYMRQHIIEMNWRSRPIRDPKILKGHDDHVITCLQFSGNRIVSGSDDNTLKVWSAVTGRCLRTLVGHTGGVWSSQMSGNIIISGSTDRTLKVWDMENGLCVHTLLGHTSTVRCMHLHGKKVVSGSRDATLRVWDIEQGTCLHVLVGHLAAVRCVQYDGKLIVSGAYDYMVKIWHPERQECLHTLQGHTNRVYSLQFDGVHVVSGSLDTSIRVWDAETGNCKHTLMGHQSLTSGMELRQNILVSGNADSTVKVWDITTGQCLQTLSGPNKHQSAVTCLQFNSRFVITSSDDGTVKLWDVKTGEFIRNLVSLDSGGSGGVVWRIRANDTKLICAVGSRNGTEETKLMVLNFDVEGACVKCS